MKLIAFIAVVTVFSGFCGSLVAQAPKSAYVGSDADVAAIRAQAEAYTSAFNKHDAKAVSMYWTEQGEYVDDSGGLFSGREEIEKAYQSFFENNPEAKIKLAVDSIRVLNSTVAIEEGSAVIDPAPTGVSGISKYSVVHVKEQGKWSMASVRDTWIEAPVAVQSALDLEWLVGNWSAEEHGVKTESECQWVAGNRFLKRKYTTTALDGSTTTGVQMIGWNPQGGYIQSWDFSPEGGHAVGIWTAIEGGWQAEVHGMTGGGIPTAAIVLLKRLDDNAYVWQSVQRVRGDTSLPDTDQVVIKRQQ